MYNGTLQGCSLASRQKCSTIFGAKVLHGHLAKVKAVVQQLVGVGWKDTLWLLHLQVHLPGFHTCKSHEV